MSFQMKKNKIMKHRILRYLFSLTFVATTFSLGGCIDTIDPSSTLTAQQVKNLTSSQQSLLNGIISYVIDINSWGSSGYPTNDWGYPCQMFYREVLGADFPVYSSNYSDWQLVESGTESRFNAYYTYGY